ncbi:MAG TPA: sialidase family protein [Candidatus Hydrogenedentes bacterium]|nr:sialidase family protein [Candidatus Hydrogenedentota bacterium]
MRNCVPARSIACSLLALFVMVPAVSAQPADNRASTGLEGPDYHRDALAQTAGRPSLPDFPYAPGYRPGITHYLRGNGIFWSIISERTHPDKRDSEGDIVQCADGSLLLAWSDFHTREWHDDAPCRISMRRSADGGRTWSPLEVLQETIGKNVMSPSLLRTAHGTVLLTFYCKDGPDGSLHYVRRSEDGGKMFGPLIEANAGRLQRIANNDRLLELRDPLGAGDRGRIILACRDYPGRLGVMVYSDDDGLTWHAGGNVPAMPEWGSQNFNEPGIVELDDGRLWMYGRTTMGFHAQAWSHDRGRTWSRPEPMALKGPCSPLTGERIPNTPYTEKMGWAGNILFTFPNHDFERRPRQYRYTARTPLDAAISSDGARTWTRVRTIEEDPAKHYGYTSITFVEDGGAGMRVLLTTHVQPIPGAEHRPHDLKFLSIPLDWFYEETGEPSRGIDFADEERRQEW